MKKRYIFLLILFVVLNNLIWVYYYREKNPNKTPTYGVTGLPKNCKAIIQANIDGVEKGEWTCEGAMDSIERNCGMFGYSW